MTTKTNFLGIPVEGDITRGDQRTAQRPLSELEPLIRAVLADDYIHSFGWIQYTPYFNDGEPCVFRVREPWFRTVDDVKPKTPNNEDDDEDDDSFTIGYGGHPTLGDRDYEWDNPRDWENRRKVYGPYQGTRELSFLACYALSEAIDSGAFEDVLLNAFGDHARVKVRRDGITVDEYSHD
ncbi:hypothetical protein GCM10010399_44030 [Dactylosporangium fulvum]|uniref:Uncharacterized protein n=1 Tax=Dactylosporangium fulvum TaxID=53359 RepID=A0ABY5W7C7_9ACTN|nr:hypothetical protein [Dactylosporangium fulvum]UWP85930.1 hypothetical protein Dfulv_17425 [Dactylosporangium fulvum]